MATSNNPSDDHSRRSRAPSPEDRLRFHHLLSPFKNPASTTPLSSPTRVSPPLQSSSNFNSNSSSPSSSSSNPGSLSKPGESLNAFKERVRGEGGKRKGQKTGAFVMGGETDSPWLGGNGESAQEL